MDAEAMLAKYTDQKSCEEGARDINAQMFKLLSSNAASYEANAHTGSLGLYTFVKVNVTLELIKNDFTGHAGSGGSPGVAYYKGHLYCDDVPRLYRDTFSFQFNAAPMWMSVVFFDGNSKVLGTFQGGGIGIMSNVGGGNGSWSKK